jgi:hypothetical protein
MPSQNQRRNGRYNKKDVRMPMLLILGAALLLMILVLPKSPVVVAVNAGHDAQDEIRTTHAGLRISEVMSDNTSALPDENGNFGDWVEVVNTSDVALNLKNVGLSDRSDRIDDFMELIRDFDIIDMARSGRVAIARCANPATDVN